MKIVILALFSMVIGTWTSVNVFAQSTQNRNRDCRIVDMIMKKTSEIDYVDGRRVPGNLVNIDYLRKQEKISPRSCLLLFVTSSVSIQDIEDFRVMATGKMQYQNFYVYLHDPTHNSFREILYGPNVEPDKLRSSPRGVIPWTGGPR